jgi:hypothetical protein
MSGFPRSPCNDNRNASAEHNATGRPVDAANDGGRPQQLASAAGKDHMPADHHSFHGEDDGR